MSATRKTAACPNCCPTGGAIFYREYDNYDYPAWVCNNCGFSRRVVLRTKPITPRVTKSQQQVLNRLTQAGWTLTTEFIGRKLWVVGRKNWGNDARNLINGEEFFGTVGPRGSYLLKLRRFGYTAEITTESGIRVYLDSIE